MELNQDLTCSQASEAGPLPEGFFYVSQDNYKFVNLSRQDPGVRYLYSDSATSCIIVVIQGKNAAGDDIAALTHLSRPARYDYFFNLVRARFTGPVRLWAQGANPANASDSITNSQKLMDWMVTHNEATFENAPVGAKPSWFVEQLALSVGQGNPQQHHRQDLGVDLATMTVSNRQFNLTSQQRDPTGGLQTIFCVFGMQVWPHVWLWEAGTEMPRENADRLVAAAKQGGWLKILDMTDQQILETYSSTPQCEAPWFSETLRMSAEYVKNYEAKKSAAAGT